MDGFLTIRSTEVIRSEVRCLGSITGPPSLGHPHRDFAVAQLHGRPGRLCTQGQLQTEDGWEKEPGPNTSWH